MAGEAVGERFGPARHAVAGGPGGRADEDRPAPENRSLVDRLLAASEERNLADRGYGEDDHAGDSAVPEPSLMDWGWGDPERREPAAQPLHDIPELWGDDDDPAARTARHEIHPEPQARRSTSIFDDLFAEQPAADVPGAGAGRDGADERGATGEADPADEADERGRTGDPTHPDDVHGPEDASTPDADSGRADAEPSDADRGDESAAGATPSRRAGTATNGSAVGVPSALFDPGPFDGVAGASGDDVGDPTGDRAASVGEHPGDADRGPAAPDRFEPSPFAAAPTGPFQPDTYEDGFADGARVPADRFEPDRVDRASTVDPLETARFEQPPAGRGPVEPDAFDWSHREQAPSPDQAFDRRPPQAQRPEPLPGGQEWFERPGADQPGADRAGLDRAGFDRNGFDQADFDQAGVDRAGSDRAGVDRAGFDQADFDRTGADGASFDRAGFDGAGFDQAGFDRSGFDPSGFDRAGFEQAGVDGAGPEQAGVEPAEREQYEFGSDGMGQRGPGREFEPGGFGERGVDRREFGPSVFEAGGDRPGGLEPAGTEPGRFAADGPGERLEDDREPFDARGWERSGPDGPELSGTADGDPLRTGPSDWAQWEAADAAPDRTTVLRVVPEGERGAHHPQLGEAAFPSEQAIEEYSARRRAAEQAAASAEAAAAAAAERASAAIAAAARAADAAEAAAELAAQAADEASAAAEAEVQAIAAAVARGEAPQERSLPPAQHGADAEPPTQAVPLVGLAPDAERRRPPGRPGGPPPGARERRPDESGTARGRAAHRAGFPRDGSDAEATAVLTGLEGLRSPERRAEPEPSAAEMTGLAPLLEDLDLDPDDERDASRDAEPDEDLDDDPQETGGRRQISRPVLAAVAVAVLVVVAVLVATMTSSGSEPAPVAAAPAAVSAPVDQVPVDEAPVAPTTAVDVRSPAAVAYLTALRDADIPTSRTGAAETEAAAAICQQLDRGADEAQLARSVPAALPDVSRTQAAELVNLAQRHYCESA